MSPDESHASRIAAQLAEADDEGPTECSSPDWSDNCNGDLETERERKKGLCEGCMTVIRSWSDDGDETDDTTDQTTLMTDGGTLRQRQLRTFAADYYPPTTGIDLARMAHAALRLDPPVLFDADHGPADVLEAAVFRTTVYALRRTAPNAPANPAADDSTLEDFRTDASDDETEQTTLVTDGGTVTDRHGIECPASVDGVDLLEADECPVCASTGTFFEHPAGYYHCDRCYSTWAGDARDASIVDYLEWTEDDDQELVTDGGTTDASRWEPTQSNRSRCQNCGAKVSREFRRVMGDENWVAHACAECTDNRHLPREAAQAGGGLK